MGAEQRVYEEILDNRETIEIHLETLLYREGWEGDREVDVQWRDPQDGLPVDSVVREEISSYQCHFLLPVRNPSQNIGVPEGYLNSFLADELGGHEVSLEYYGHEMGIERRGNYLLHVS